MNTNVWELPYFNGPEPETEGCMCQNDLIFMTEVKVRFQREGWHAWPDALERRAYLRNPHRHVFWYEVSVGVGQDEHDRGIEFHDLLDYCREQVDGPNLGANSCEMLAYAMAQTVQAKLANEGLFGPPRHRVVEVTVWEDNECGATVTLG